MVHNLLPTILFACIWITSYSQALAEQPDSPENCKVFCWENCARVNSDHLKTCREANSKCSCIKEFKFGNPLVIVGFVITLLLLIFTTVFTILCCVFKKVMPKSLEGATSVKINGGMATVKIPVDKYIASVKRSRQEGHGEVLKVDTVNP